MRGSVPIKKGKICKLTKSGIKPCQGLDEVLQMPGGQGTRRQGVELQTLINLKTGKFSRHWVVLKSGKHGRLGIVMNNCPFCAATIFVRSAS
jgi:hypothetical protein